MRIISKDNTLFTLVQELKQDVNSETELISNIKKWNLSIDDICNRLDIENHSYLEDAVYCVIKNNRKRADACEHMRYILRRMLYRVDGVIHHFKKIAFNTFSVQDYITEANKISKQLKIELNEYLTTCNTLIAIVSSENIAEIERGLLGVAKNPDQELFQLNGYIYKLSIHISDSMQILNELKINQAQSQILWDFRFLS